MQTADVLGWYLGIRGQYLRGLSRLFLAAYTFLPARYRDPVRCREGGAWDLEPKSPSSPWHPGFRTYAARSASSWEIRRRRFSMASNTATTIGSKWRPD